MSSPTPFYGVPLRNGLPTDPSDFPFGKCDKEAYEVFRVIDHKPLFFSEHLTRLERTLRLTHADVHPLAPEVYIDAMRKLQHINMIAEANVRMSLFISPDGNVDEWWMGFTPHKYPNEMEYHEGVMVKSLSASRSFPNAKLVQAELRKASEIIMENEGAYEIILMEPDGEITEASRSNIFFIKDNILFTAPNHKVLEGVTRLIVLRNIGELGLPCRLESLNYKDMAYCDAALLTGTSRNVLPVRLFDDYAFNAAHPYIRLLQEKYDESVMQDLALCDSF